MKLPWRPSRGLILWAVGSVAAVAVALALYWWPESGFDGYTVPPLTRPQKTLWDWLELFLIPAVLAVGGYLFNRSERETQQRIADERRREEAEEALAKDHAEYLRTQRETAVERVRADARARVERERTASEQREAAFQHFLDRISDLMLVHNLRASPSAQEVARVRTLSLLARLGTDGERKGSTIRFLHEASLIQGAISTIALDGADLRATKLPGVNLQNINLRGTDLREAMLDYARLNEARLEGALLDSASFRGASMEGADLGAAVSAIGVDNVDARKYGSVNLSDTNLTGASLTAAVLPKAQFQRAHLENADLRVAHLRGADFTGAFLMGADLTDANLTDAIISEQQLKQARSITRAILPDGSRAPDAPPDS